MTATKRETNSQSQRAGRKQMRSMLFELLAATDDLRRQMSGLRNTLDEVRRALQSSRLLTNAPQPIPFPNVPPENPPTTNDGSRWYPEYTPLPYVPPENPPTTNDGSWWNPDRIRRNWDGSPMITCNKAVSKPSRTVTVRPDGTRTVEETNVFCGMPNEVNGGKSDATSGSVL